MARIRGSKSRRLFLGEDAAAVNDDANNHEVYELGRPEQQDEDAAAINDDVNDHEVSELGRPEQQDEDAAAVNDDVNNHDVSELGRPEQQDGDVAAINDDVNNHEASEPERLIQRETARENDSELPNEDGSNPAYVRPRRRVKKLKQRSMSDLLQHAEKFSLEWGDDSDFYEFMKKASEGRDAIRLANYRKRMALETKEPQLNESETSSRGPKGNVATRKLEKGKRKRSGERDRLGGSEASGSGSGVGQHVAAEINDATGLEVDVARVADRELPVCTLNKNPADFLSSFESEEFWRIPG